MKNKKTQYRAKVTNDSGLTRGRVPCPFLNAMGARSGDYLLFRLSDSNKVVMRLSRSNKKGGKKRRR